ncbi:MAG: hypothetical protein IKA17_02755 [Clostridia bacterium]|nr:hypothetical protein [Clostridia bacterium]
MSKGNEEVINIHQSDSQEYRGEDKDWDSYFDELEDSEFKKFYINNTKEKKYLRKKVDGKDLKSFASRKFLLEDIWKCLYTKEYMNKFNLEREVFQRKVINYYAAIMKVRVKKEAYIFVCFFFSFFRSFCILTDF